MALPDASAAAPGFAMAALWAGGFFALGLVRAMMDSAIMHYSIAVAAPELRISASVVLYTMMGVLAGVIGLSVSSALLGRVSAGGATDLPGPRALAAYRAYFRWILVLLAPLSVFMLRIIPLPEEVRMTIRHHHVSH